MWCKKIITLSICLLIGISSLFSQGKLINAGKVGGVSSTIKKEQKKQISQKKPKTVKKQAEDKHSSVGYMDIIDITFANVDGVGNIIDKYGSKLYAKEVKYLKPKISYNGLASTEKEVTLSVKIFDEDGKLKQGTTSPMGYTYSKNVKVVPGKGHEIELLGWGKSSGGSYKAGLYKVEVWCKDNLLIDKEIRLYSGTTPIATSNLISISSVSFANVDSKGNVIDGYGSILRDGKVQYLKPKIYYNGKYSTDQEATLYYRIFKSSGDLVCGNDSPIGFSNKNSVTIKSGSNSLELIGYGNDNATNYKEGTCKLEIWLDGEKIYETNIEIRKAVAESKGNEMVLRNMLEKPMGVVNCNPITAHYSTVKEMVSKIYTIDDSSDDNYYKFYVWNTQNSNWNLSYHGIPFYYYALYVWKKESNLNRRILYGFKIKKEQMKTPDNPYHYLDKIVQDFKDMGINMSYERKKEEFLKAEGSVRIGNIKYEIELNEWSYSWEFSISIWVRNN